MIHPPFARLQLPITLVAIAILSPMPGRVHGAPGAQPLTLDQSIQVAITNAPRMAGHRAAEQIASLERENAAAAFWPSLDFTAGHGLEKPFGRPAASSGIDNPWRSQMSLALTEKLYDNGESSARRDLKDMDLRAAKLQTEEAKARLTFEVTQGFYRYSLQNQLTEIKSEQAKTFQRLFKNAEVQYRQGNRLRKDFLRVRAQAKSAEADLRAAQAESERLGDDLRRLLGFDIRGKATDRIEFALLSPEIDPVESLDTTLSEPDVTLTRKYELTRLQDEARRRQLELVRAKRLPEISLSTGAAWGASDYLGSGDAAWDKDHASWNVMLTLKYNLWDHGTRQRDVAISLLNNERETSVARGEILDIQGRLAGLMNDLREQRRNFELVKELLALETESYQLIEAEYRQGRVPWLDLVTSLNTLLTAKSGLVQAWASLKTLTAEHRYYTGR